MGAQRKNRSDEELRMRMLVADELRKLHPGARIIHELPLRYSERRLDVAAICDDKIVAAEIKSSVDVMDRLEHQIRAFLPVTARVIIALAPKWNQKLEMVVEKRERGTFYHQPKTEAQELISKIGGNTETWTVDANAGAVEITERCYRDGTPWSHKMLEMLWRNELAEVAARHQVCVPPRASHLVILNACEEVMTGREVRVAVCRTLRQRDAFDKASDAPSMAA